jgi:hypothetical protein
MVTPVMLQIPTESVVKGVVKKDYADGDRFNVSWKSKGGTETLVNGVLVVQDTVEICCWFNPKIQTNCRIKNLVTGLVYEIYTPVENVDSRSQFAKFKIKNISGGC